MGGISEPGVEQKQGYLRLLQQNLRRRPGPTPPPGGRPPPPTAGPDWPTLLLPYLQGAPDRQLETEPPAGSVTFSENGPEPGCVPPFSDGA